MKQGLSFRSDFGLASKVLRITPELFEIHKQRAVDARRAQAAPLYSLLWLCSCASVCVCFAQVTASNVLITLTDACGPLQLRAAAAGSHDGTLGGPWQFLASPVASGHPIVVESKAQPAFPLLCPQFATSPLKTLSKPSLGGPAANFSNAGLLQRGLARVLPVYFWLFSSICKQGQAVLLCQGGPLHEDCARILEAGRLPSNPGSPQTSKAYTFFRPDIGYVQGMHAPKLAEL